MTDRDHVAALVRAIRRAHPGELPIGIVSFRVADIHEFAERLLAEGVTVKEPKTRRAA